MFINCVLYLLTLILNKSHLAVMQGKTTSKWGFTWQIKHNTFIYGVFEEQGQNVCSIQPREKRTSDMCEIIKYELCMVCKMKK